VKPETIALVSAVVAALSAAGSIASAVVSYFNGKRQVEGAQVTAEKQIAAAHAAAQLQIESAQTVARQQLNTPMREAWIGQLRDKLSEFMATNLLISYGIGKSPVQLTNITTLRYEISYMLNPFDNEQRLLGNAIDELLKANRKKDKQRYQVASKAVHNLACLILRSEWGTVSQKETEAKEFLSQLSEDDLDLSEDSQEPAPTKPDTPSDS
jgi:hypothetical protein